jgi:WD40 repeat protein
MFRNSENNDCVISASEDGNVYIWNKRSIIKKNKLIKNDGCLMFRPFEDSISTCSFSLNEADFQFYQRRMLNVGVFIRNVIISVSKNGKLQVLVNPVFIDD